MAERHRTTLVVSHGNTAEPRRARCATCGEVRELATREECYRCYRQRKREEERAAAEGSSEGFGGWSARHRSVDRHSQAIRREHRKLLGAYTRLIGVLGDLRVNEADVQSVIRLLTPYLELVAQFLPIGDPEHEE